MTLVFAAPPEASPAKRVRGFVTGHAAEPGIAAVVAAGARLSHVVHLRISPTTGLIAVHCSCQADALDSRSRECWEAGGRSEVLTPVLSEHLADVAKREKAAAAPAAEDGETDEDAGPDQAEQDGQDQAAGPEKMAATS